MSMGITTEETDTQNDIIIGNELSNIQNGKYYMGSYSIHWSLDLTLHRVTINITNRPDLGSKIIDKKFSVAEFRVDEPWYRRFHAKISGNFTSRQLSLDGNVIILTGSPRPGERWYTRKYENVIITTW